MSNEELIQLHQIIVLTTYLTVLGYLLGTALVFCAFFKLRKTALLLGAAYGFVIFITPYTASTILGFLIFLGYLGFGIHKLVKYLLKRKRQRAEDIN